MRRLRRDDRGSWPHPRAGSAVLCVAAALLAGAGRATPEWTAMAAEAAETLASAHAITLGDRATEVTLLPTSGARPLAGRLAALPPGRRVYLSLKGARAAAPPSTLYRVYLGPAPGASGAGEAVGSINFFNAELSRPRDYSFDVTDRLKALEASGALGAPLTAAIVPTAQPSAAAKPTIAEVALVAQ
jgi:hypothetical protein